MVFEEFGVTPDAWQADALAAFADPTRQRIALQACAGPGKSAVLAWCGLNFLACYSDGTNHPNGAVFSVTGDNLKNNLWKEFAVWRGRSPFFRAAFEMTAESIFARDYKDTWFLNARSWAKSADAEQQGRTLSGLHAKSVLILGDESGDIPPSVLRAGEQAMSNCAWGKIVQAGNPTSHTGMLYHSVKEQAHLWHVIRITGDPADPKRSPRVGLEWAQGQIDLYGRDNPWVMAFILGKFPPTSVNALLGPDEVAAAMGRHLTIDQYEFVQKRIGVDVARFGDDRTVLFPRQGLAAFNPVVMRNAPTQDIAARLILGKSRFKSELELIDDTGGWAAGVIDACGLGGVHLMPINFSGKADDPRYFNKRSEMHFRAAEWVKAGGALPNIAELAREATAPTYWFENGKMRVVEKETIKKQLQGHSPDYWDALCLTFAIADLPGRDAPGMAGIHGTRGHAVSEWDPTAEPNE